jgi:demethylmenaquinone methyltransferase/2-methoxy-6-polyprenyl-1,4-benzoquinol methylase
MPQPQPLGPPAAPDAGAPGKSPRKRHALDLFVGLPRRYHLAGALMSFGQDPRWRRTLVAAVRPGPGDRVLDVATGTGLVARALVRARGCRVVALDQSPEMLGLAREVTARDPSVGERISFVEGEAERLPFEDGEFDHLTFTYLLRYVDDPAAVLRELARVVRPGGRVGCVEFGVPEGRVPRPLWRAHTRIGLPTLGRLFSADWQEVGRFLGPSIEDLYARHPLAEQVRMWEEAGLGSVAVRRMSFGAGVVVWATRHGDRDPD